MRKFVPSLLDVKLAVRMLFKYPGLSLVGGLAMTVAIAIGAVFDVVASNVSPSLPLDEGDRVVAIENWDAQVSNQETRILADVLAWRTELRSVEDVGAYRTIGRNLIVPGTATELVPIAEMSASGFRVARVPPLFGRPLLDADEGAGAAPVLVIGADVWRTRFQSDPSIVGREVRLGDTVHTVVGVMPEGFAFPMYHRFWIPLQANPGEFGRREGPGLLAFGRLAPGATLDSAQAELSAAGQRAAAAFPDTHGQLRPRVIGYTAQLADDFEGWEIVVGRVFLTLLLVVICVNVAVLVYARTATRQNEITVRSALGASRRRIVAQLFTEALVLSLVAAAIGLVIAGASLRRLEAMWASLAAPMAGVPFWIDLGVSPARVVYVVGLAVLAALIVGVVPALKATGRGLRQRLGQIGSGTRMQLGRTWTVLIVAQVAFAVAALPASVFFAWEFTRYGLAEPGFAAEEFLTASVVLDGDTDGRYAARLNELERRLEAEPGVSGVAMAPNLPGQEPTVRVAIGEASPGAGDASGHETRISRVSVDFFDVFDIPTLAGRQFEQGDLGAAATGVIVNRAFVREILADVRPLGQRIRYVEGYRSGGVVQMPDGVELGRAYEIVGVVGDLPPNAMEPNATMARLYHAFAPGQSAPVTIAVRTARGATAAFTPRLQAITTALDPSLQVREVRTLDAVIRQLQSVNRMLSLAFGLLTLSVLLLSAAGIYALMSFVVTQRRREIGIRAALGADPRHLLASIFVRASAQLAVGVLIGAAVAVLLNRMTGEDGVREAGVVVVPLVAFLMVAVGLIASIGPARRGLRVDATEALKTE